MQVTGPLRAHRTVGVDEPDGRGRRAGIRWRPSARLRILGWSMLLIAVALVTTTVATHLLLMHRVDVRIRNELAHENDEFRAVAAPPASGSGSVSAVLRTATARGVSERTIALVGVVDGRVVASSVTAAPLDLSAGSPLVTAWAAATHPTWASGASGAGPIRYLAVPFHVTGDPRPGVFVAVIW